MEPETIKFKTIQYLNGSKYLSQRRVEDLCHLICYDLKIEKNEENFNHVKEACQIFFTLERKI